MSKQTAEIIIRHLLGIVVALRKEYSISNHEEVVSLVGDNLSEAWHYKSNGEDVVK